MAAPLLALAATTGPAWTDVLSSDWVEGLSNKARLLGGRASGGPVGTNPGLVAGLEIVMSPGFKTYWRNPGEAGGVPPELDFSSSENLQTATVLYPAPHRTKDKAGENIAYKDRVTFPVVVTPKDASRPIKLNVKAAYGVCKDICIPAEAELALNIPADVAPAAELSGVLATVPAQAGDASIDPAKDPLVSAWRLDRATGRAKLVLDVSNPADGELDAFLFSPDGLYMPMTSKAEGAARFEAELTEGASLKELAGKSISVTLVGAKGQSETLIQLPNDLATP